MNTNLRVAIAFTLTILSAGVEAQTDIPVGTWRLHLSYNNITHLAAGGNVVFAATESGILVLDRSDNSVSSYNTLNALTTTGISALAYDDGRNQLLVGYEDGNLDLITDHTTFNFNRLATSPSVIGSKRINDITIRGNTAYLSTDFGIVLFNLVTGELIETWRNLGESGESIRVQNTVFDDNRVYAATSHGVIEGDLGDNLLDFNHWIHHNDNSFGTTITGVALMDGMVFAAIDGEDLFRYNNGTWEATSLFTGADFHSISGLSPELLVTEGSSVWIVSPSLMPRKISSGLIHAPQIALATNQNIYWIGDRVHGLVSNVSGEFNTIRPNGPAISSPFRLAFAGDALYALRGGFSNGQPLANEGVIDVFRGGAWSSVNLGTDDVTEITFSDGYHYAASFGGGVVRYRENDTTRFDGVDSPFTNNRISTIGTRHNSVWAVDYAGSPGLHRYRDNQWTSFSTLSSNFTQLEVDLSGRVWLVPDPQAGSGLIAYDPESDESFYFTTGAGFGDLPHARVNAVAVDHDGYVWVGTDQGIAYFYDVRRDAVRPVFEGRFLLQSEKITAITVDGGNRKWVATTQGAWLFDETGEQLVANFNQANSPLLSQAIRDIAIHPGSGEVFFSTDKGIVSYRSDATEGAAEFSSIRIFPNPVSQAYPGTIAIDGLVHDAIVKITDSSGKLMWETRAHGGMATWNLRDYNGKRASVGVYVVFAATENGSDRIVGKIAVVD